MNRENLFHDEVKALTGGDKPAGLKSASLSFRRNRCESCIDGYSPEGRNKMLIMFRMLA